MSDLIDLNRYIGILAEYFPNVVEFQSDLVKAFKETIVMVSISGSLSLFLGLFAGVFLVVTAPGGLYESKWVNSIVSKTINIFRSIPFVILVAFMVPFTRLITGTSIGLRGAVPPLVIGIVPFISRVVEQALYEVDKGVIEAAMSMGISKPYIIVHILIREALPGIVRALVISFISLIGLSTMAGAVGGGGVGSFAIRYGYARYMTDVTAVTVLILLLMVNALQGLGNIVAKKLTH
ncbi:MAG: ABC transporter permease [Synergistaceae bacterium]|nr:ABC transporter permease [Synergistaceae bacterium]